MAQSPLPALPQEVDPPEIVDLDALLGLDPRAYPAPTVEEDIPAVRPGIVRDAWRCW